MVRVKVSAKKSGLCNVVEINVDDPFTDPKEVIRKLRDKLPRIRNSAVCIKMNVENNYIASFLASFYRDNNLVAIYDPRQGGYVTIKSGAGYEKGDLIAIPNEENGTAIGIVGDPNSGKSVFTYLLTSIARESGYDVFRQEGDYAAPTPEWFFISRLHGTVEVANKIRKMLKTSWEDRQAQFIAESVERLKKTFKNVIVDLGGGRPPHERVTPQLKKILEKIDKVIIVCPKNRFRECVDGWIKELKQKAPHVKISAIIQSTLDPNDRSGDYGEYYTVYGLDRDMVTNPRIDTVSTILKIARYVLEK